MLCLLLLPIRLLLLRLLPLRHYGCCCPSTVAHSQLLLLLLPPPPLRLLMLLLLCFQMSLRRSDGIRVAIPPYTLSLRRAPRPGNQCGDYEVE